MGTHRRNAYQVHGTLTHNLVGDANTSARHRVSSAGHVHRAHNARSGVIWRAPIGSYAASPHCRDSSAEVSIDRFLRLCLRDKKAGYEVAVVQSALAEKRRHHTREMTEVLAVASPA